MQVAKWGKQPGGSPSICGGGSIELEEGDQIEIRIAGGREFEIFRDRSKEKAIEKIRPAAATFASRF